MTDISDIIDRTLVQRKGSIGTWSTTELLLAKIVLLLEEHTHTSRRILGRNTGKDLHIDTVAPPMGAGSEEITSGSATIPPKRRGVADGSGEGKRRGRPPGSKNRPKGEE